MAHHRALRLSIVIIFPIMALLLAAAFAQPARGASPNVVFAQCAPGQNGEDPKCIGQGNNGWVTGKVGPSKANYKIGDFIAYRGWHQNLDAGKEYCFAMWWDIAKAELPAIDYIGTYSLTLDQADPTHNTPFTLGDPVVTLAIPKDPILDLGTLSGNSFTGVLPVNGTEQGVLTLWGGTNLRILGPGYSNTTGGDLTNASQSLEYCFTSQGTDAVLAWGGHIADPVEWSAPDRPPGSPYHMRTGSVPSSNTNPPRTSDNDLSCDDGETIDHFTVGSQDLQLGITGQPTAVTMSDLNAAGVRSWTLVAIAGVLFMAMLTLVTLVNSQRGAAENENSSSKESQDDWNYDDGQIM